MAQGYADALLQHGHRITGQAVGMGVPTTSAQASVATVRSVPLQRPGKPPKPLLRMASIADESVPHVGLPMRPGMGRSQSAVDLRLLGMTHRSCSSGDLHALQQVQRILCFL